MTAYDILGKDFFEQLANDDELWEMCTSSDYTSSNFYCPVAAYHREVPLILNQLIQWDPDEWGASCSEQIFIYEYEKRTGFTTTGREVAEHIDYVRCENGKIISQFEQIPIEYSELELERTKDATDNQKEAILHQRGNMLINATAGSGKTYSIANLVALKIQEGLVAPDRIAMITFTRKAANVMRNRLIDILGNEGKKIKINTFHGLCLYLLNNMGELSPYYDEESESSEVAVIDENQSKAVIKDVIIDLNLHVDTEFLYNAIQRNKLFVEPIEEQYHKAYETYNKYLNDQNVLDYSDLLFQIKNLCDDPDIRTHIQGKFDLVCVDEYQDCNNLQAELAAIFTEPDGSLVVVGDADQAIMGFQGANVNNILQFHQNYVNVRNVTLPDNFRSRPQIVNMAKRLIEHNDNRIYKPMKAVREDIDNCVDIKGLYGFYNVANHIKMTIAQWNQDGVNYGDIAILGRTNGILTDFYAELNGTVPCDYGNTKFFDRMEIKDLHAYMTYVDNDKDPVAFKRISKHLNGVGAKTVENISGLFQANLTLKEILDKPETRVSKKARASLEEFDAVMTEIREESNAKKIMGQIIDNTTIMEAIKEAPRKSNIEKILQDTDEDISLEEYFKELEHFEVDSNLVTLSTFHKAKGNEWKRCIIVGVNEGLIPHFREDDITEERRCFYVGMTRAEDHLLLLYDKDREPSRFLNECRMGAI